VHTEFTNTLPASHVHALAPAFERSPTGHSTHVFALVAPETLENESAGHFTHVSALVAPVTPEYVPAEQFVHTVASATAHFPAAHATQTPFCSTLPTLHRHLIAPAFETSPTGHRTHVFALVAPETFENEPSGHDTQKLAFVAPIRFEYVPEEQFVHTVALANAHFPAAHAVHAPFTRTWPASHGHVYVLK